MEINKQKIRRYLKWAGLTIWLALPVFLLILPADYFDTGTSICPSQLLLHRDCPGCGLTRSVQHAIHFEFPTAFAFNKLIVIVLPILGMFYLHLLGRFFGKSVFPFFRKFY